MRQVFCAVALAALIGPGCAVGNQHQYHSVEVQLTYQGSGTVQVSSTDERPYVVDGGKQGNFVGLTRGGFGNPFNVTTAGGHPLASAFTQVASHALQAAGFTVVDETPGAPGGAAVAGEHSGRRLVFRLLEWKSDTFNRTTLAYHVELSVQDSAGKVLAAKTVQGNENLGGSFWNPPAHARKAVPGAFKEKLEQLLNAPEVQQALAGSAPRP